MSFFSWSAGVAFSDFCRAVTSNSDFEGFAGAFADQPLHLGKVVDGMTANGNNKVARLEARRSRSATLLYRIDARAHRLLAVDHEHRGKNARWPG